MRIHFGRLDQAHDGRGTLSTAQRACKQPVGAPQCPGPYLVFHPVVIDRYLFGKGEIFKVELEDNNGTPTNL